ncbi:MAG: tRNA (adenosine(37)-N6)-dimethylallyltransferase MiaA [Anaerolineales bacterium]|nr:tRNA (adenosine(37)-N6)-dimethylallyltransferase MiaA [Anaerolineales bacterium]
MTKPHVVVILGPTAVGKTELSLRLAEKLNCEIVSIDSRLIYRGMDIGTAKPSQEERSQVRHHMIDIADPDEVWSLATFIKAAMEAIAGIHQRGILPLLVGGTGQYATAILEGWTPPPLAPEPTIRHEYEDFAKEHGHEKLHAELARVDPASAERIQSTNVRRVIRALEIFRMTGIPASEFRKKSSPPYQGLRIGLQLPREELYTRVDARIDSMFQEGFVEEVSHLLQQGYGPDLPSMSAIGYKQVAMALRGELTMEEAALEMRRLSRQFIRRQANWFKLSDPDIHWFEPTEGLEVTVLDLIQSWLRETQYDS